MLISDKKRLALLVAEGISYQIIASIYDVSPGRISQMLEEDTELQGFVAMEHAQNLQVMRARTAKMETGIDSLLDVIPGLISECTDIGTAVRSLAQLTALQQQARGWDRLGGQQAVGGGGLTLHLSNIAEQQLNIQVDGQKQIIAIQGQTVRPMGRSGVESLFAKDGGQLYNSRNEESDSSQAVVRQNDYLSPYQTGDDYELD